MRSEEWFSCSAFLFVLCILNPLSLRDISLEKGKSSRECCAACILPFLSLPAARDVAQKNPSRFGKDFTLFQFEQIRLPQHH